MDNLEDDYQQNRDWCSWYSSSNQNQDTSRLLTPRGAANATAAAAAAASSSTQEKVQDKVSFMAQQLSKHMENKERFLRVSFSF